ncbi:type ISP restriction/modification enzyme [Streptomyces sp. LaPpAH-108]|uniref:type ISP restriction/modification enzyme n=1 Tax=Streptomyces sp. LaPpAH-108 TaxID=1155714 RepID=UPI000382C96C|nr:type ISP restriction/modification enzyme [Streptomyces sp. LaPpAH-108]
MPGVTYDDDAPPLADLMPWSVAPLRPGRAWPTAPDAGSLKARWAALLAAEGAEREGLFEPTRARSLRSAVARLPGHLAGTERLARASGPCVEPVRVLAAPFDERWLIPDHRLLDAARPELWRVADAHQVFVVETGGEGLLATSLLPTLPSGRIRPLYRRPGGTEPNLAPGLSDQLARTLGDRPTPEDFLAWTLAAIRPDRTVPLTGDAEVWARGVELGHRLLWLMRRDGDRPKLPGGRRPYVRAPLPARPSALSYDADTETLCLDEGRISPVPRSAWEHEVFEVRTLEAWFEARTAAPPPGGLAAIRPASWPQPWTSELLELITVLALLAEIAPARAELKVTSPLTATELHRAGVLPPPSYARRPASVLDHQEEGPEGQFALL